MVKVCLYGVLSYYNRQQNDTTNHRHVKTGATLYSLHFIVHLLIARILYQGPYSLEASLERRHFLEAHTSLNQLMK